MIVVKCNKVHIIKYRVHSLSYHTTDNKPKLKSPEKLRDFFLNSVATNL